EHERARCRDHPPVCSSGASARCPRATAVPFRAWALRSTNMKATVATGQLLERSEELARIESVLAAARSGQGTFVVVEGPAGIGKTALLAAARTAATEGGMHVLRARGTQLERDF